MAINRIKTGGITDGTIQSGDIAPGTVANDRLANSSITINGTAVSLGGSVTAGTNWQAVVVADGSTTLTAEAGKGYFLDTNTGVIEVFLPSSPSRGDTIVLADYSGTFSTNKVLINTGGKNIDSTEVPGEFELTTNNTVLELVFVDNDKGWLAKQNEATSGPSLIEGGDYTPASYISATGGTVTTSGNFKIHTFTGDGCFVVSCAGNFKGSDSVDYLVIAGGGGAGSVSAANIGGGGGGAGGYRESSGTCYSSSPLGNCVSALPVSAQTYPVTVGGGGAGGPSACRGSNGSNSSFSTITSAGGGYGGGGGVPAVPNRYGGGPGGSGGGMSFEPGSIGAGNTPPVSPPQGQNGGQATEQPPAGTAPYKGGAGGGGAGGAGEPGQGNGPPDGTYTGGVGGAGVTSSINGTPTVRASGGSAGTYKTPSGSPAATPGGGGGGGPGSGGGGQAGTANTGGGGGGGGSGNPGPGGSGGAGGKGLVIIRYKYQ